MSADKLILIRSLGYLLPQSGIKSSAVMFRDEETYDLELTELSTNPLVLHRKTRTYILFLELENRYVPEFNENEDEDGEEEVVEEAPKRRGRKTKVVVEEVPPEPTTKPYFIQLRSDVIEETESTLGATPPVQEYLAKGPKSRERLTNNFNRLGKYLTAYNQSIESIAPQIPNVPSDLLPPELANDIGRTTQTGIEVHAEQMRKNAETHRDNYDKVIQWFRDKVLVNEVGTPEPLNLADLPANLKAAEEEGGNATYKQILDAVKAEFITIV